MKQKQDELNQTILSEQTAHNTAVQEQKLQILLLQKEQDLLKVEFVAKTEQLQSINEEVGGSL